MKRRPHTEDVPETQEEQHAEFRNVSGQETEDDLDSPPLKDILFHLRFPVAFLDRDFNFIHVNPAYARVAGNAPDFYPGKHFFHLFPHEEHQRIFQRVVDSGEPFETFDRAFEARQDVSGNHPLEHCLMRWDWSLDPVSGKDGRVRGLVLTLVDNSEHWEAHQTLEHVVEELERKNRELQDFAYVASHDLQEPLRKIRMFADRLTAKYADALDQTGLDYLQRMNRASRRMAKLIEDLLSYSRVTTRARPFQEVDLENAATTACSNLEARIEETRGEVTVQGLPTIEADPNQMVQLLQNLIGNGLKFHREGLAPRVTVQGRVLQTEDGKQCEITVQDNGVGFPPEYSKRIFMPFQRLHGRSEYEGTGIGLALCRKIVKRHGGSLTAESEPGQGARFVVTLPMTASDRPSIPAEGGNTP